MTRAEFEDLTADLVEELLVPIRRVLDETGAPKAMLDAVTLVGGGSRVPIIQEKIKKLLKRENLDSVSSRRCALCFQNFFVHTCGLRLSTPQKLNGDEAVATGLAAYGASQAQGKEFRRDLKIVHSPFPAGLSPSRSQVRAHIASGGSLNHLHAHSDASHCMRVRCLCKQLVEPLQGDAWDEAATTIEKLTRKAAALAAHQQALSDFEALLFRWDEKLNSDLAWEDGETSEEAEVEEESSSWFSGGTEGEGEASEIDGDVTDVDSDVGEPDDTTAASVDVEPTAELTDEEKAAAVEAAAAAAKAVEDQKLLVATGQEWLAANSATASTEELLAQLQDLDLALNELEPELEPEEDDLPPEEETGTGEEESDGLTDAERQHAILHHFYAKYAPKTDAEVQEIIAKRKGDSDSLSEKAFEDLCRRLEDKYGESPASMYAVDRAMGMFDEDDTEPPADELYEDEHDDIFPDEEAAELDQKQRERQISILHAFYGKYAPKSEEEIGDIM